MPNKTYWKKRFEAIEAAKVRAGDSSIHNIESMFRNAQNEIESKIQVWYGRFAENNQINLAEAKRLLKTGELAEFKWNVKEYIKYGQQVALNPAWMQQLENASARFHVSRLEALQLQTQQTMEKLFGNQLDVTDRLMKRQYLDNYYHTFYETQKGFNIGFDVAAINERQLKTVISKPWAADGRNFSDRIWQDKTKMLNNLHTELTQNMILGRAPDAAIRNISKSLETSKYNAGRLVMTESAYFSSIAQKDAFNELDVERYEVVATLDTVTSDVCKSLDGQVFRMADFEAGVTAPPFHPWCRSVTVPYFDDDFGERVARDPETGKTFYVPQDMKYEQWHEKFVKPVQKPPQKSKTESQTAQPQTVNPNQLPVNENSEIYQKIGEQHYKELHSILENAPERERKVWIKLENDLKVISATANVHPHCRGINGIKMNVADSAKGNLYRKPHQTTFHEFGHNIDFIANKKYGSGFDFWPLSHTYKNGIFADTIKREINDRVNVIAKKMRVEFNAHKTDFAWLNKNGYISDGDYNFYQKYGKWISGEPKFSKIMAYKAVEKEIKALSSFESAGISDIMGGATDLKIEGKFGHLKSYWKKDPSMLPAEAFADMFDSTVASPEALPVIKKYFPESYKIFQEMLDVILKG